MKRKSKLRNKIEIACACIGGLVIFILFAWLMITILPYFINKPI